MSSGAALAARLELSRELPTWMFDRAACAPMRIDARPRVDVGALEILRSLNDVAGAGAADGIASSNAPVLGVQKVSHDENRGEADAVPAQVCVTTIEPGRHSSICSRHPAATRGADAEVAALPEETRRR